MTLSNYQVLIIGCGNIAGGFDMGRLPHLPPLTHVGAYKKNGFFVVGACVDPDENKRQAFAKYWEIKKQVSNVLELQALPKSFDVISICSPTSLHYEHFLQVLSLRPRVIFCEKPMTLDVVSASKLVKKCAELEIALVVNYSRRWDPLVLEFAADLNGGRWGVIRSVIGHYNKGILNNGGHMIDLLLRLLGPLELVSSSCVNYDFWESDPTLAALLTANNGTVPVYLNPSNARDFSYFELEIICELGVIRMDSGGMSWQFRDVVSSNEYMGYQTLGKVKKVDGRYFESMSRAIDGIYHYLKNSAPKIDMGEEALLVQRLCEKILHNALGKTAPYKQN